MTQSYKRETEMPISVQWLDEKKEIIYERFTDPWTLTDWHQAVDEHNEMLASRPHTVYLISDMTEGSVIPSNILMGARYASKKFAPNAGMVIYVRANRFGQTIANMAQMMFPNLKNKLYFTETTEAAIEMAQARIVADQATT